MRVLVAPDAFSGTLTAPEAARAVVEGWRRHAPDDELTVLPMADGGPGFVDTVHAALGGEVQVVTVAGPHGESVPATVLLHEGTAYVESSQACGPQLLAGPDPWHATSLGVGQAVAAALDAGATTVVVGLGGTATHDGGAGLLAGLGAVGDRPLDAGPEGLRGVGSIDLAPARERIGDAVLVAAGDVAVPLLGMFGATKTFGPDHGLDDAEIIEVDGLLDALVVAACGSTPAERRVADEKGAGAGGGLGFALMALGARWRMGAEVVADAVDLQAACSRHDLVVSGEGTYDHSSRSGKVVHGVALAASAAARPCIALAGQVTVGAREMRAMGVESAYSVADLVGLETAMSQPHASLASLAERVARTWSPRTPS